MTLEEFASTLTGLQPGTAAHVPYEVFDELFPPGIEDEGAKGRAYKLADANGCVIENRSGDREVLFVKAALTPETEDKGE